MKVRNDRRRTLYQIFAAPVAVGVLCIFGLTAALLGNGIWDAVASIAVAAPLAVVAWFLLPHT